MDSLRKTLPLALTLLAAVPALAQTAPTVSQPVYTPIMVTAGFEAQSFLHDGGVSLRLGFEGQRWGFDTRYSAIAMGGDAERWGYDDRPVSLLNLNLTYALHASPRARVRVEVGGNALLSEQVSMMGPGFGASMEACIAGPLDLEGRLQLTPFPFRQLDAQAGLALRLGSLAIRGGLRALHLDDVGRTDGIPRANTWTGPYAGLSLIF